MSDLPEFDPSFDPSAEAAELDNGLTTMTENNIEAVKQLFETPPRIIADIELEHLPEMYDHQVTVVSDDARHRALLDDQLKVLGVRQLVVEEPYLSGTRRLYEAEMLVGKESKQVGLAYWLDEQHTQDTKRGAVLRLRATRDDPRQPTEFQKAASSLRQEVGARIGLRRRIGQHLLTPSPRRWE